MKKDEIKNSSDLFLYKAMIDFNAAQALYKLFNSGEIELDLEKINYDIQQSVEKLLKSILAYYKIEVPKTHDIERLSNICKKNNIQLIDEIYILEDLTAFAVDGRYDIICDDINDTELYIETTMKLLNFVKEEIQ